MEITKEYLESKKVKLEAGLQQAMANYTANKGAIQLINILLEDLGKEVKV